MLYTLCYSCSWDRFVGHSTHCGNRDCIKTILIIPTAFFYPEYSLDCLRCHTRCRSDLEMSVAPLLLSSHLHPARNRLLIAACGAINCILAALCLYFYFGGGDLIIPIQSAIFAAAAGSTLSVEEVSEQRGEPCTPIDREQCLQPSGSCSCQRRWVVARGLLSCSLLFVCTASQLSMQLNEQQYITPPGTDAYCVTKCLIQSCNSSFRRSFDCGGCMSEW